MNKPDKPETQTVIRMTECMFRGEGERPETCKAVMVRQDGTLVICERCMEEDQ